MRVGAYILAMIHAGLFGLGSTGPAWLCIRADGFVRLKADSGAPCELACIGERDDHDRNVSVALTTSEGCCLDIPIGVDARHPRVKPARPRRADSSLTPVPTPALCARSAATAADLSPLTQSHPPGPSGLSFPIRTVILLI